MPFLQSLSNLFSSGAAPQSRHTPRRSIIASDAFHLPTTNPVRYGESGLDANDGSPGPSRRGSMYPPTVANSDSNARPALSYYPPLTNTFHRLRNALADSYPELIDTINPPVNPLLLRDFEQQLGCPLPPPVRDSFMVADGQDIEAGSDSGMFYGLYLLPLDDVMREWKFWRQVEADPSSGANPALLATMASIPPQWTKSVYACRGWIPLISDRMGNYVGVDLDPGTGGAWGQVIVFGRDFDRKCVLWHGEGDGGWGKWLAGYVDEIESGEGWEADNRSDDDEEELGYSSYAGAQTYGDLGRGFRLSGQYKGWGVLEAWWDRSVRKWEELGLGMDVKEIERGLDEARRLTSGKDKHKNKGDVASNIRAQAKTAVEDIPVVSTSPPPGVVPRRDESEDQTLLPPASPEAFNIPHILHPEESQPQQQSPTASSSSSTAVRVITPRATTADHHPLKTESSGLLTPPARSSSGRPKQSRPPPPAPSQLDLPTRADVQAAAAVAHAQRSGLRGGWVMNLDSSAGAAQRRTHSVSPSLDAEMVDIDLESGRNESFGTPTMRTGDEVKQSEEDRLSLAGIEHRRSGGARSPVLLAMSRTPSPLSRNSSYDQLKHAAGSQQQSPTTPTMDRTPRDSLGTPPPGAVAPRVNISQAVESAIRKQTRAGAFGSMSRSDSPSSERDRDAARSSSRRSSATPPVSAVGRTESTSAMQRKDSVMSADSGDVLLEGKSALPSTAGPGLGDISTMNGHKGRLTSEPGEMRSARTDSADLADGMQEISL